MDSVATLTLLEIIEDHKDIILSKSGIKSDIKIKQETWSEITEEFQKITSLALPSKTLTKKWKNAQGALKTKINHSKITGGGEAAKPLNSVDQVVQRILGENNPVLNRIPGSLFTKDSTVFSTKPKLSLPSSSTASELDDDDAFELFKTYRWTRSTL